VIALATLVALLGGIAIHHSQSPPSAQSVTPPGAGTPGTGASVTTVTLTSGSVRSRSDEPSTAVELRNAPARRGLLRISGIPSGRLAPGLSAFLDLVLTNPNAFPITVRRLMVRVRTISAPRGSLALSCSSRDFTVAQFSGGGLRLRAASTTSLGHLGVAQALWPRVSMPNRTLDQDGCKGASLTLDYRGVARR
jgi:hypothetical protein